MGLIVHSHEHKACSGICEAKGGDREDESVPRATSLPALPPALPYQFLDWNSKGSENFKYDPAKEMSK